MTSVEFFLLDIKYYLKEEKPIIQLFGKTLDGKQAIVEDATFLPSFRIILKKETDAEKFAAAISDVLTEHEGTTYKVVKTEIEQRKYKNRIHDTIKVYVNMPSGEDALRLPFKEDRDVEEITEFDLPYLRQYLLSKQILPFSKCTVEGTIKKNKVLTIDAKNIVSTNQIAYTRPNILGFDIETYNPFGKQIDPEKNPIIMAALSGMINGKPFNKVFTWKKFPTTKDYIEFVPSEEALIIAVRDTINTLKPDIISGYFSDEFDFPYFAKRAKKHEIPLHIGATKIKVKKRGEYTKVAFDGLIHIDILSFVRKVIGSNLDTESYRLGYVAEELLNETKDDVDIEHLATAWDKHPEKLETYCKYNLKDADITFKLTKKLLPNMLEFVAITGLPLYDISRMSFSKLVEWYLIKNAMSTYQFIPNRPSHYEIRQRRAKHIKGAFVFEPEPGIYKDIAIYDFRSLYPTIIASHNLSAEKMNCSCCKQGKNQVPGFDLWFCEKEKGFVAKMIEQLVLQRIEVKKQLKNTGESEKRFLDARQNALKLLANSFYGYLAFFAARWYSFESAEATTAFGRNYIKTVISAAEQRGFKVLYSDTDSIFLSLENGTADAESFAENINKTLPGIMELEFEGKHPAGIFVSTKSSSSGAKKKYALLNNDGSVKIKGFETVRRNWSFIAKEMQQKLLEITLKKRDAKTSLEYVQSIIHDLRNHQTPVEKLIIYTQLQKNIEQYDAIGPHVAVAQRMKNKGLRVGPGTIIKYVISTHGKRIRDRARMPDEVSQEEYDAEYYINHQVVPGAERILHVFGYTKEDIVQNKKQSSLSSFF